MSDLLKELEPAHGFSLANIAAQSVEANGFTLADLGENPDGALEVEPVYPPVSAELAREKLEEYGEDIPAREEGDSDDDYTDRLHVAFGESDAYHEWKDSFFPIMNAVWPVELAYGLDAETAAERIDRLAGAVSLVIVESEGFPTQYALTLTGGGMDLTDHLIRAYACCGSVPPLDLMRFEGWAWERRAKDWLPVLDAFQSRACDWLATRADRIKRDFETFKAEATEQA